MNPYKVLKVRKTATQQSIERAYRKLVKILHPDRGGSTEKFNELQEAYAILSDPTKRKHYDETGEVLPDSTRLEQSAALELLISAFDGVLREAIDRNAIKGLDLKASLKATLNQQLSDLKSQCQNAREKLTGLADFCSRLTAPDPLISHAQHLKQEVTSAISQMDTKIAVLKQAIDVAETVEYRRDENHKYKPFGNPDRWFVLDTHF